MRKLGLLGIAIALAAPLWSCASQPAFETFSETDDEPITRETLDAFVECDEGFEEKCECVKATALELVPSIEGVNFLVEQGPGGARPVPGARRDSRLTLAVMQASDICSETEDEVTNAQP